MSMHKDQITYRHQGNRTMFSIVNDIFMQSSTKGKNQIALRHGFFLRKNQTIR